MDFCTYLMQKKSSRKDMKRGLWVERIWQCAAGLAFKETGEIHHNYLTLSHISQGKNAFWKHIISWKGIKKWQKAQWLLFASKQGKNLKKTSFTKLHRVFKPRTQLTSFEFLQAIKYPVVYYPSVNKCYYTPDWLIYCSWSANTI